MRILKKKKKIMNQDHETFCVYIETLSRQEKPTKIYPIKRSYRRDCMCNNKIMFQNKNKKKRLKYKYSEEESIIKPKVNRNSNSFTSPASLLSSRDICRLACTPKANLNHNHSHTT